MWSVDEAGKNDGGGGAEGGSAAGAAVDEDVVDRRCGKERRGVMREAVGVLERYSIQRHVELAVRKAAQRQVLGGVEPDAVRRAAHEAGGQVGDGAEVREGRGDLLDRLAIDHGLRTAR